MQRQLPVMYSRAGAIGEHRCLATRIDPQRPARWPAAATRAQQLPPMAARVRQVPAALDLAPAAHWMRRQMSMQSCFHVAAAAAAVDDLLHRLDSPLELASLQANVLAGGMG